MVAGDEEGLCDLGGAEAREVAQGEPGLRVQVESRVTAREHELQPVVGDVLVLCDRFCAARRIGIGVQSGELGGQRGVPPDPVKGLAPGRGRQPGQRLARDPGAWPGLYRCQKGLSGNLLGEIEVAEPGREQGQQTAVLLSEHCLDRFACRPIALILRTRRADGPRRARTSRPDTWPPSQALRPGRGRR